MSVIFYFSITILVIFVLPATVVCKKYVPEGKAPNLTLQKTSSIIYEAQPKLVPAFIDVVELRKDLNAIEIWYFER